MKRSLMAAALAVATAIAAAQDAREVTVTSVLDTATPVGGSVYSGTYVPVADKFIASPAGTSVVILNAQTGAVEGNLDVTGVNATGLGLFALTAGANGVIYGYEDGAKAIYRWEDINSAPENVYEGAAGLFRVGAVGINGNDLSVAFTGAAGAGNGPVEFFSDSMPFASESFTFNESIQLDAKSALAMNSDGTEIFTVGDSGALPLTKWSSTDGVWGAQPDWESDPIGGGPMAYDEVNDVLLLVSQPGGRFYVLDGSTGEILHDEPVTAAPAAITGYNGGFAVPDGLGSGTVYLIARGATAANAAMYVYEYTVSGSSVDDWSLYEQ